MENVLKAFAKLLTPYFENQPEPVEYYTPENIGLSKAEQLQKHNEGLKVFQAANFETQWNIERTMLELDNLKEIEKALIGKLNVAEGVDAEAFMKASPERNDVKEVTKVRAKIQSKNSTLAEEMDKCFQQEAFITSLKRRIDIAKNQDVDLLTFRFKTTGQIRGEEDVA